jgi:hypothetical protein
MYGSETFGAWPLGLKDVQFLLSKQIQQDDLICNTTIIIVEFEVLTAAVMKSTIFCDITPCSPLKVNRCFGGTYRLHLQGRISRAWYQRESRWLVTGTNLPSPSIYIHECWPTKMLSISHLQNFKLHGTWKGLYLPNTYKFMTSSCNFSNSSEWFP